jgi:hypothetical protein
MEVRGLATCVCKGTTAHNGNQAVSFLVFKSHQTEGIKGIKQRQGRGMLWSKDRGLKI